MSTPLHAFLLYKFGVITVGAFVVYLGYRLLLRGAFDNTSDLKVRWGERELTLSRAAPGSLFALFGAGVMVASLALSRFEQVQHLPPLPDQQPPSEDTPAQMRPVIATLVTSPGPQAPLHTAAQRVAVYPGQPGQDGDDRADSPAEPADVPETSAQQ